MKKCFVSHLAVGFSLVTLPFLSGCTQQNAGGSNPFVSSASAETVAGQNDLAVVTEAVTNAPVAGADEAVNTLIETNSVFQTNAIAQGDTATLETSTEQKPPPNLQLSPVLSEAVKMVQSGVNQSVLLAYVTNTTGYFGLGAEEIVYLNDLGVTGDVLTAMMEHDKALRELRSNAWQAAQATATNQPAQQPVEPEPDIAAAPTYVEAPSMEAEPVYVSSNYFYDTLSPYGSWVYVPGYGRCWRPTAAVCNPGWRPYVDRGRWVYSDCGWYWLSDYSWGSTAFHYGRWFNDNRVGWCWYPDTVWAPSWVSWRYTSDYCGWAPLPPATCYQSGFGLTYYSGSVGVGFGFGLGVSSYAFVPWGNFCAPRPYQYCVPASRAVHVYNNSKPFNRWEGGGHGRAYNRGLAPERVRELSRAEVRTVSLKEQTARSPRGERLERDGRTLAVRRPQFTSTSADAPNVSGRNGSQPISRTRESVGQSSLQQPATSTAAAATANRTEVRSQREQWIANRTDGRLASPSASLAGSTVEAKPEVITRTRGETISPQQATTAMPAPTTSGGTEVKAQREQRMANRTGERRAFPTPAVESTSETKPQVITSTRVETRTSREGTTETGNRLRTARQVVGQPLQSPATPPVATAPASGTPAPTIKAPEPRITQSTPQANARAAQRSSIIVIGNNNARSGGRDYSVYSTPSQSPSQSLAPSSSTPPSSPRGFGQSAPSTAVNTPAIAGNAPAVRAQNRSDNGQNRGNYNNRSENRGAYQTYSAPQAGQVINPRSQSTPAANYNANARPVQSAPAQSYAPRSQPSAQPSAARVEARSATAQTRAAAPATSQPIQNQGRPNR